MLAGELVTLRAIEREDVPDLHTWGQEYATWPEGSYHPYAPRSLAESLAKFDAREGYRSTDSSVDFAMDVDDALVGSICLWGLDAFNRRAHLGITVGTPYRGKGYGTDACRVLVRYAFVDRGLHRVQLEVLANNAAAVRAYEKAGFVRDGVLREAAWVRGELIDEVVMSVLSTD